MTSRQAGQVLTLRFSRDAEPDMTRLRVSPPKWLKSAEARHVGGVLEMDLTLEEGAEARVGQADGAAGRKSGAEGTSVEIGGGRVM